MMVILHGRFVKHGCFVTEQVAILTLKLFDMSCTTDTLLSNWFTHSFPIISVSLVLDAFSSARPQNTHTTPQTHTPQTHTHVHLSTCHNRLCEDHVSLCSYWAKDGGQREVSGCPHHPVVIKAHCMLGLIAKLHTETLDTRMCALHPHAQWNFTSLE